MIDLSNTDIFKLLISREKDYIKELGTLLNCGMASNLNKEAIAFALTDFILNHSREWMRMLSVREITLIEELLKHEFQKKCWICTGEASKTQRQPIAAVSKSLP